jgi:YHS domain-containing protein
VQILKGLEPGHRIVVSGNFLIDSESRMRFDKAGASPPAATASALEKDVVCEMDVDPKAAPVIAAPQGGKTYYFCSDHCRKTFEAAPDKYIAREKQPAHVIRRVRGPA